MPAPARIHNPTPKEAFRLQVWRLVQAFSALPPVFYVLSFLWPLVGVFIVCLPVYGFWQMGDQLGMVLLGIFALGAIFELARLPLAKRVSLPAKLFWSLMLGVPVLGILFFWIAYHRPEAHSSSGGTSAPPPRINI